MVWAACNSGAAAASALRAKQAELDDEVRRRRDAEARLGELQAEHAALRREYAAADSRLGEVCWSRKDGHTQADG